MHLNKGILYQGLYDVCIFLFVFLQYLNPISSDSNIILRKWKHIQNYFNPYNKQLYYVRQYNVYFYEIILYVFCKWLRIECYVNLMSFLIYDGGKTGKNEAVNKVTFYYQYFISYPFVLLIIIIYILLLFILI